MSSLSFRVTENPVPKLRLTVKELEKEANRAAVDTARRLQTRARAKLVENAEIAKGSAVHRIRQYGNKVWFGTDPVVATAPALVLVYATRSHRGLVYDGEDVKRGFALTHGPLRNLPFVKQLDGKLVVLRRDISDAVKTTWVDISAETAEVFQAEMDKRAERVIRRR